MAIAWKVVGADFRSYIDEPTKLHYVPGCTVEADHPVGLSACTSLEDALERVRKHHKTRHVLVIELRHSEDDVVRCDGSVITLARCRVGKVVADSEPVDVGKWGKYPRMPGASADLAPVAAVIPPRPFHAVRHGLAHARRTAEIAASIIGDVHGADPDVVAVFALLHDAKRASDDDSSDGPRVAKWARKLQADGVLTLSEAQLETLCTALADDQPAHVVDRPDDRPLLGRLPARDRRLHRAGVRIDRCGSSSVGDGGSSMSERVDQKREAPAEMLLATATISAYRLKGRPRDPEDGRHKRVVVFAAADMRPIQLAADLRAAADRLETLPAGM